MDQQVCAIFDIGSQSIKAGLTTTSKPKSILSLAGKPKYKKVILENLADYDTHSSNSFHFYSEQAYSLRGALKLSYPIQNGLIHNWDKFEQIISHSYFDFLKIDPSSVPVFIIDAPQCPFSQRQKLATFFVETLRVPSLLMTNTVYARFFESG